MMTLRPTLALLVSLTAISLSGCITGGAPPSPPSSSISPPVRESDVEQDYDRNILSSNETKEAVQVETTFHEVSSPPIPDAKAPPLRLRYTVKDGDLLTTIAQREDVYGDPLLWPLLYQANRDQIKDPRKIYAGQVLTIPRNLTEHEREEARVRAKKSGFFSHE